MPIVISFDPVAQEAQMAGNVGQRTIANQGFGQAMQLAQLNQANAARQQAEADRQRQLALQQSTQQLQGQEAQANENYRYANMASQQQTRQQALAAHVLPGAQREQDRQLALQQLEQAHSSGMIDDATYTRAQTNLLAGDHNPMGGDSTGLQQDRMDLSKNRFDFQQQYTGHLQQRRAKADAVQTAKSNLDQVMKDPRRKYSPELTSAQQALQAAQNDLAQFDSTPLVAPAAGKPAAPAGAQQAAPAAGGLKPTPRSVLRQAVQQAQGDGQRAAQLLQQQGFDPGQVVEDLQGQ